MCQVEINDLACNNVGGTLYIANAQTALTPEGKTENTILAGNLVKTVNKVLKFSYETDEF
jgi:hypothetical protein